MHAIRSLVRAVVGVQTLLLAGGLRADAQVCSALMRWHHPRFLHNMSHDNIIILVVVIFAVLGLLVWAVQRRRRRWF